MPVFDTVAQAVAHHGGPIYGSVVTVPPAFTKDAVFEAIENGVELVVIVTERIPRRDVAQMVELATPARRAHHRPQLPRDHRARRDQDGRDRRPGEKRRAGLHARTDRRDLALRRHDHGDVLDAQRRRTRAVDRGVDRRRRDHRLELRGADAAVRGRRADPGHRHLHRARRPHGGRARTLGDRATARDCRSSRSWRGASWTRCPA